MDINNLRKILFINSQYCTYYNENKNTVLAGVFRDYGYKCANILSQNELNIISQKYRNFTTIMNIIVGVEILLYLYLFLFPYFTEIMKFPFFLTVLTLCFIPLIGLYLTYIFINTLYENFLKKTVKNFKKVKFKPDVKNIDEDAFQKYLKNPAKSIYVLAILVIAFVFYALSPIAIDGLINLKNYKYAINFSNLYTKLVPITPSVYAQRAYSEFKLGKYQDAVNDYELANKYTLSNSFDLDILGVKTYYLPQQDVLNEFDKKINEYEGKKFQHYIMSEKAAYLLKNKQYKEALDIYNILISAYKKDTDQPFAIDKIYYLSGLIKRHFGDIEGANADFESSAGMCPNCKYDAETTFIQKP